MTSPAVLAPRGRQRIPFVFGQGLDRATGALIDNPGALADARNLYVREAKLAVRPGLAGSGFAAIGWGTDVVGVFPLAVKLDVVTVVFDRATLELRVYRHNPIGNTTQLVDTWGTLNASARFPLVHAAECAGVLLLAHDEPTFAYRFPTQVYTPGALDTDAGTIADLEADLDQDGTPGPVCFRGVTSYLEYVFGWGFGNEASAGAGNRPEIVRHCVPADPLSWNAEGYFQPGAVGDPVLACGFAGGPSGSVLLVEKAGATFAITGEAPADFGLVQVDDRFGIAGSRLGITVAGRRYTWSAAGPRMSTGGPSDDLALPLELDGPEPATLAAAGAVEFGWAAYDEARRLLLFGFPDVANADAPTRVYAASLHRDPPQFSYLELQQCVVGVGAQLLGKGPPPPVTGYASAVTAADVGLDPSDARVRGLGIAWTNNSANGDESVEVRIRAAGASAWELLPVAAVGGATQALIVSGADPLTDYDVAIRYVRGAETAAGYADAEPDNWTALTTAGAKTTVTTDCETPVLTSAGGWARVSPTQTQVALHWTLADLLAPVLVRKSPDGITWTDVALLDGSLTPRSYTYLIPPGEVGVTRYFDVVPQRGVTGALGTITGTPSNAIAAYLGPTIGVGTLTGFWRIGATSARAILRAPTSPAPSALQVDVSSNGGGAWTTAYLGAPHVSGWDVFTDAPSVSPPVSVPAFHGALASPGALSDVTLSLRWRYGLPGTAGTDWGDWGTSSVALASSGVSYPPSATAMGWPDADTFQVWPTFTGASPAWSMGAFGWRGGPLAGPPPAASLAIVGVVVTEDPAAGATGLAVAPPAVGTNQTFNEPVYGPTSEPTWLVEPPTLRTAQGFAIGRDLAGLAFFVTTSGAATAGPWFRVIAEPLLA